MCGVAFKVIKDRLAATRQLALGFWWDSTTLTRELEEKKLLQYLDMLDPSRLRGDTADVSAPLAPQALETGDFGIVEPIL